ncbi:MAG: hypothetical protein ABSB15_20345 [Bryobacteraceae bacterium]
MFPLLLAAAVAARPAPVFTRDIAPIIYKHCSGCHHEGQVAPFPLLTYEDTKKRARLIAEVTRTGLMPPWQTLAGYGHFVGERRLTAAEISTIQTWVATGAREGDLARLPPPPVFNDDWQLGPPDMVVTVPGPMEVPADGPDIYECFIVPLRLAGERYLRAAEFRPGNRQVVHHALLFFNTSRATHEPRYPCYGSTGVLPVQRIGVWSPGNEPIRMIDGAALPLGANAKFVAQIHYHPDGKPEKDEWSVGLYFTDKPPVRRVVDVDISTHLIDIPAGDAHYVVRRDFTIPIAVDVVGVIPHAHLLCRQMRGWAIEPDGSKRWLLNIRDWNPNWQDQYQFVRPIRLPADTRLEMEFVYDNSAANPRNPHAPPVRVRWGPGTDDEMASLDVRSIPVHSEEMPQLGEAMWGAVMRSVGGRFYSLPQ